MTPTKKFCERRRVLEPRYRCMKSWNFKGGQVFLKIIFWAKMGPIFTVDICSEFRMRKYRDSDYREDASHFNFDA